MTLTQQQEFDGFGALLLRSALSVQLCVDRIRYLLRLLLSPQTLLTLGRGLVWGWSECPGERIVV